MAIDASMLRAEAQGKVADLLSQIFRQAIARGARPIDVADVLVGVAYDALCDQVLIHDSVAGLNQVSQKSQNFGVVEKMHEELIHRICQLGIRRLEKISKYKFTCVMVKKQKPL